MSLISRNMWVRCLLLERSRGSAAATTNGVLPMPAIGAMSRMKLKLRFLRNLFRSEYRKRRREVEDTEGTYAESLKSHPEQHGRVEFEEFRVALATLPPDQRAALILVGASGFSYKEAAAICDCAVGTIKSRVNRARIRLSKRLSIDRADDFGPDDTTRAIFSEGGRS